MAARSERRTALRRGHPPANMAPVRQGAGEGHISPSSSSSSWLQVSPFSLLLGAAAHHLLTHPLHTSYSAAAWAKAALTTPYLAPIPVRTPYSTPLQLGRRPPLSHRIRTPSRTPFLHTPFHTPFFTHPAHTSCSHTRFHPIAARGGRWSIRPDASW